MVTGLLIFRPLPVLMKLNTESALLEPRKYGKHHIIIFCKCLISELENFQNLILKYASKRNSYKPPAYRARNELAALDHNAHWLHGSCFSFGRVCLFSFDIVTNVLISPCIFLLIAYIIWHLPIVFYLKKNRMARRHAPFDKKNMAPCIADVPFFISSNDPYIGIYI
jgi:hypothetical protein